MRVYTYDPYSYNAISLKKNREDKYPVNANAGSMIADPVSNLIGKFLGINTKLEWSEQYDKVFEIVKWAREKTGKDDAPSLVEHIKKVINESPQMNNRRIDDIMVQVKLDRLKKQEEPYKVDYNGHPIIKEEKKEVEENE